MRNTQPTVDFMVYKDNLLFVHESNLVNKYKSNYKGKSKEIYEFYLNSYLKMREKALGLTFDENHRGDFDKATKLLNDYYSACERFADKNKITSQSKFASTFLEEISAYLFKDIPEIRSGEFGIFNKNIYAGLKLDSDRNVSVITKDVDFCIGKKVEVEIKDTTGHSTDVQIYMVFQYPDGTYATEDRAGICSPVDRDPFNQVWFDRAEPYKAESEDKE